MYSVKETFLTLQGEGFHTGRTAVFCRFTGCNLWTGSESDRESAVCTFCDTDFVGTNGSGGGKFAHAAQLGEHIANIWGRGNRNRFVVFTGGEPLLQLDAELLEQVHRRGFQVAVESNGTLQPPAGIDWLTVSPKGNSCIKALSGQELKLVFPQEAAQPAAFEHLPFDYFYLQPMDGLNVREHVRATIQYCVLHPQWRLSLQVHKVVGIP